MIKKFLNAQPASVLIGLDLLTIGGTYWVATQTTGLAHWAAVIFCSIVSFFLVIGLIGVGYRWLNRS